jgi:hypothetical protein
MPSCGKDCGQVPALKRNPLECSTFKPRAGKAITAHGGLKQRAKAARQRQF